MKSMKKRTGWNKRVVAASGLVVFTAALWGTTQVVQAQEPPSFAAPTPPTPVATPTVKKELTQEQAVQIALKKVPGKMTGVPYTTAPQPYLIRIHSKQDKSCVVTVDRLTGTIKKVVIPRLTRSQAIVMARRKAPGRVMVEASSFYEDEGVHHILIEQSGNVIAEVLVSDKTGKVIKVSKGKDSPG